MADAIITRAKQAALEFILTEGHVYVFVTTVRRVKLDFVITL